MFGPQEQAERRLAEQRREREAGVANSNAEESILPAGDVSDELTIPDPATAQDERPSATVTQIGQAARESKV